MTVSDLCPECDEPLEADAPKGVCPRCLLTLGLSSGPATGAFPPLAPEAGDPAGLFPLLELLEPIGQGGMGEVHRARQVKLDRLVALKLIRPDLASQPAFAERFAREARAMARLNHPNIVTIHDFGEAGGTYYLLMELVDGGDLRRSLAQGPLKVEAALVTALQVCEALEYAHGQGVVHRDIKPENVLRDARGRVKLADFGLAKLHEPPSLARSLTASRHVLGTPHYMAPEQLEGAREVDHRADLYSLGVLFYEMLTGKVPFGRYDLLSEVVGTDEALDEILDRLLRLDPGERPQSAGALRAELAAFASEYYELANAWPSTTARLEAESAVPVDVEHAGSAFEWWHWVTPGFLLYWFVLPPLTRFLDENLARGWPRVLGYVGAVVFALAVGAAISGWRRFLRRSRVPRVAAPPAPVASPSGKPQLPGDSTIVGVSL